MEYPWVADDFIKMIRETISQPSNSTHLGHTTEPTTGDTVELRLFNGLKSMGEGGEKVTFEFKIVFMVDRAWATWATWLTFEYQAVA